MRGSERGLRRFGFVVFLFRVHRPDVGFVRDAGKDVIYVRNTQTNEVQKITSESNEHHFRIVEVHPNADPKLFEAVISDGSKQGPVKFPSGTAVKALINSEN